MTRPTKNGNCDNLRTLCMLQLELFRMTNEMSMKSLQLVRMVHKRRRLRRQINENYTRLLLSILVGLRNGFFKNHEPPEGVRIWVRPRSSAWWDDVVPQMDAKTWKEYFRMSKTSYELLCQELVNHFEKKDTSMRRSIPLQKRIAMCLHMLATSSDFGTASLLFGVGKSTIWESFRQFCLCVATNLSEEFIVFPSNQSLQAATSGFSEDVGFPQCLGVVTTIHLPVVPPKYHAADYYNDDGWHSIAALTVCDYAHRFIFLDVGYPGRKSNTEIFRESKLSQILNSDDLNSSCAVVQGTNVPLTLLGPNMLPLLPNLMTPYLNEESLDRYQKSFNSKHAKAVALMEETIRKVRARFPILARKVETKTENFPNIVRTCFILHNLCEILGDSLAWNDDSEILGIRLTNTPNLDDHNEQGIMIRDALAQNFIKES